MTIALVDVGTTANDGTGDPLRTAFQTVNTALTRLDDTVNVQTGYVLLKDDSGSTGVAVTTAGDVGIGTTSPTEALDVRRAATTKIQVYDSSNTRAALLLRGSSVNNSYEVRVDPSGGYSWHARGSGITTHYEDVDAFIWRATGGASTRMILNGTGLNIGTTAGNGVLNVNGGADVAAEFTRSDNGQILELDGNGYNAHHTLDGTAYFIGHTSAGRGIGFQINGTQTVGYFNTSGHFGIGTTSPSHRLHVTDLSADTVALFQGATAGARITIGRGSSFGWDIGIESSSKFFIETGIGDRALTIDPSTRYIGIGTTAPTEALDVNSDAIRVRTSQTPASASATGDAGQICWDADYIYVCTATNTWKRAALATW